MRRDIYAPDRATLSDNLLSREKIPVGGVPRSWSPQRTRVGLLMIVSLASNPAYPAILHYIVLNNAANF
jgi:hypothetical protein